MRNYAELVKDLRYCADLDKECLKCKTFEQHDCFNKLGADAADAIEELLAENKEILYRVEIAENMIAFYQEGKPLPNVPKWHPVSEPPKENKEYLVYIPNVGLVTKANYLYGKWNYDNLHMEINHLVSHWMPLPESPKEVE